MGLPRLLGAKTSCLVTRSLLAVLRGFPTTEADILIQVIALTTGLHYAVKGRSTFPSE